MNRSARSAHAQHPPDDLWLPHPPSSAATGTGRVESAAIVHHPVHPVLKERVPYVIAIVSVDGAPGCSVQGNVVGCPPEAVQIGQRVRAVFEEATDKATGTKLWIPQWELAPGT
jgi:uncharacterized OB-fold protein